MNTVLRNLKVISIFAVLIFAIFFPIQTYAVTLQKSQLNTNSNLRNGLVGYWPLDGSDVTDKIYDRSGSGLDGGFYGGSTTTARTAGKLGQAMQFDGINDEVTLPDSATLRPSSFTLSGWYYLRSRPPSGQYYVATLHFNDVSLYIESATFYPLRAQVNGGASLNAGVSAPNDTIGVWHHAVVTENPTASVLYFDGVQVATGAGGVTWEGGSHAPTIGALNDNVAGFLDGNIDDVRVYNRALSATEVKQLYNLGQSVRQKSLESKNTGLKSGLVGYWPLDGADVTDKIYDRSGSGNNGGFYGGTTATTSARTVGKIGQALNFDGDDKVSLGNNASLNPTDAVTISAWINTPTPGTFNMDIIDKEASGGPFQYVMRVDGGIILFRINGGTQLVSANSSIKANTWYHVVGTYDRSFLRLYINGVANGTPVAQASAMSDSGINLSIGSRGVANDLYFTGIIDDVRIYNRALSATEVKQLYSLGQSVAQKNLESQNTGLKSGLVGYWTFDGPDVTTAIFDRGSGGNNAGWYGTGSGTITSTTSARTYGKLGQALQFDGTDDYVDLGSTITSTFNSSFSVSLWYFHTSTANQSVIGKRASANSRIIVLNNSSTDIKTGQENVSFINTYTTPANWVGSWHHIIWTYNATTHDSILYADGVLRDTQNYTFTNTFSGSTLLSDSLGGLPFNGKMDDVRIYNRVLTSTEVQQLYNMGK